MIFTSWDEGRMIGSNSLNDINKNELNNDNTEINSDNSENDLHFKISHFPAHSLTHLFEFENSHT
jgi:hypothetical protein